MHDIIGDIHGHADELVELLERLGYREQQGTFRHPSRQVLFLGDFIDRGPRIRDVLTICRSMCEQGEAKAVMGNHEFNALAFATPHPDLHGEFLRPHSRKNLDQHQATLDQLSDHELTSALEWFRTLPMWRDLGTARIVHACWSDANIEYLALASDELGRMTPAFLHAATTEGNPVFESLECILKGPEHLLPDNLKLDDRAGHPRRNVRVRWFDGPPPQTFTDITFPRSGDTRLLNYPPPGCWAALGYSTNLPPVFFGHYWLTDDNPAPVAPNAACLDYSVARGGKLVAYRFDGEQTLSAKHFVSVPSRAARRDTDAHA
jgi:hypothetical protein